MRIANIKWQDMIPNTEVLQRCAQTGIEHYIKRVQLRLSGRVILSTLVRAAVRIWVRVRVRVMVSVTVMVRISKGLGYVWG